MRAAIRKNTQIRRQLSKVRVSLSTEEKEAHQAITRGNFRLVAKLNQLKIKAKKTVESKHDETDSHDQIEELPKGHLSRKFVSQVSMEKLDNRSKTHRNKLYRQPTLSSLVPPLVVTSGELERPDEQPDLTKYQIPSWQRAEKIAKQNQEAMMKQKIYGKKRR